MPPLQQQERHARAGTLYGDHRQEELIAIAIMPNSDPDGDAGWPKPLRRRVGQVLSWFGFHDLRVIEVIVGFGVGGPVQRVECQRCGRVMTRRG